MTAVHGFYLRTETLINNGSSLSLQWCSVMAAVGARVDLKDKEKNTSLHIAARNGHASVVKTLISYCADMMK